MRDARELATWCGTLAALIALGGVYGSTVVSTEFTWRAASLSSMGRPSERSFLLFNGGLVLGGIVGLPFGWTLWRAASNRIQRAGVVAFVLAVASMTGVGVAYLEGPYEAYHFPTAAGFFFLATVALWVHGSGTVLAGEPRWGLAAIWLGIAHVMSWLLWILIVQDPELWFAVPEAVGATAFGGWVLAYARRLRTVTLWRR